VKSSETTAQLLPKDRSFNDLLLPYIAPYLIYIVFSSIPESMMPNDWAQGIKFLATGAALFVFREAYRFGSLKPMHGLIALLALPLTLLCWIGPFYLLNALGIGDVISAGDGHTASTLSFYLRLVNSVFLVAIFEELFMRVYILGWFYQAGHQRQAKGLIGSIVDTLDQRPTSLAILPLSRFSVVGTTIVFTAGHRVHEYLSAILYFLFTTWLYKKSGSLWVCIVIHGLTNLAIALLVKYGGMAWLW
jgi:membrane protease YdiL (CAAX protease family)